MSIDPESAVAGGGVATVLAAVAWAANKIWGTPEKRMAHELARDQQEHLQGQDREAALLKRVDALETRLDVQAGLLTEQGRQLGELTGENRTLRERVQSLEDQLEQAGLAHIADLATISDLRSDLEAAKTAISTRDVRIRDLEARVSELEEQLENALSKPRAMAKAASKKARKVK